MANKKKKANKTAKIRAFMQTNEAQITASGRVISDHPSNFITPAKLKATLQDAENGDLTAQHELFMDIEERDSAIAANIQTRKRAILTLDWRIAAPRNATTQEESMQEVIDEYFYQYTDLENLMIDLMDAIGHGFSAIEICWELRNGKQVPTQLLHRPASWFMLDKDDNLLLKTPANHQGEPLRPFGWLVHQHKSRSVQLARSGLYRSLAWLYMFKHYAIHDFAEFLELYGMPIRIGKYGAGATADEKRTLLRALAQIGHNAAGIMPESMNIELHNIGNGASSNNNPFLQMADWCEKSIARLILGQTLTSGADGKSSTHALGTVHNEVRRDLLISDAKQIAQTITQQLILPYIQINIDPNIDPTRIPYFEFDIKEREDLTQFAQALPKLVDIGVRVPENWVREKLGIPEAYDDEPILKRLQSAVEADLSVEKKQDKTALSALCHPAGCSCGCGGRAVALSAKAEDEQGILDGAVEQAFNHVDFNQQLNPIVKQAVEALQACNSYEEAFNAVANLYPTLDTAEHQRYLTQALFVSELLGASNAKR